MEKRGSRRLALCVCGEVYFERDTRNHEKCAQGYDQKDWFWIYPTPSNDWEKHVGYRYFPEQGPQIPLGYQAVHRSRGARERGEYYRCESRGDRTKSLGIRTT